MTTNGRAEQQPEVVGETLFKFQSVSKVFARDKQVVTALADASFDIRRGEFLAIVGPSGCGKSTLLNLAAGLMDPTRGSVSYMGAPLRGVNTNLGYVTQRDNLLPWRRVNENIGLGLEIRGMGREERAAAVADMIDRVGLTGFGHHYPAELSGGMRKRVTLARTLVLKPETLAMDEPFGALDAQLKLVLQDELLRLWSGSSQTCIFVTHDLAEAVMLADRVVAMSARPGRIRTILEIDIPRPRNIFTLRFTDRFSELHQQLWNVLEDDFRHGVEV